MADAKASSQEKEELSPNAFFLGHISSADASNRILMFGKSDCKYCKQSKQVFDRMNLTYKYIVLDEMGWSEQHYQKMRATLKEVTDSKTVPQIFIDGKLVGGHDSLIAGLSKPLDFESRFPALILVPEWKALLVNLKKADAVTVSLSSSSPEPQG
jgi:glutaredoxin